MIIALIETKRGQFDRGRPYFFSHGATESRRIKKGFLRVSVTLWLNLSVTTAIIFRKKFGQRFHDLTCAISHHFLPVGLFP